MVGSKSDAIKWLCDQTDGEYEVKPYHSKRSLTANSYYWVLTQEYATVMKTSREEVHEIMLRRYGYYLRDADGNIVAVTVAANTDMTKIEGHYEYYDDFKGGKRYKVILGSRHYDSREFSHLLDGLISECKEVGIETLPPHELEKLRGYEKRYIN